MSQDEPLAPPGPRQEMPKPMPEASASAGPVPPEAARTVPPPPPRSNPINLALLELQDDSDMPMTAPAPPMAPAAPAQTFADGTPPPPVPPPFPTAPSAVETPAPAAKPMTSERPPAPEKPPGFERSSGPEQGTVAAANARAAAEAAAHPLRSPAPAAPSPGTRRDQPRERLLPHSDEPLHGSDDHALPVGRMILIASILSLPGGMLCAWAYDHLIRGSSPPANSASDNASSPTTRGKNDELESRMDRFNADIQAKLDALKAAPPVDLTPIEKKLSAFETASSKQAHDFEALQNALKAMRADMASLQASGTKPSPDLAAPPAPESTVAESTKPPIDTPKTSSAEKPPVASVEPPKTAAVEPPKTSSAEKPPVAAPDSPKTDVAGTPASTAPGTAGPGETPTPNVVPTSASPSISQGEKRDRPRPLLEDVDASGDDPSLSQGIDLFKKGKYQDAHTYFAKLVQANPTDARVWYYAALSRGIALDKWDNDTLQLVEKGLEREKAGTPRTVDIESSLRDLTSATGKEWLNYYRERKSIP